VPRKASVWVVPGGCTRPLPHRRGHGARLADLGLDQHVRGDHPMPSNLLLAIQPPSRSGGHPGSRGPWNPVACGRCRAGSRRARCRGARRERGSGAVTAGSVVAGKPIRRVPGRAALAPGCRTRTRPARHGAPCGLQINPVTEAPPRRPPGPGRGGDEPGPHPAGIRPSAGPWPSRGCSGRLARPDGCPVHTRRAVGDRLARALMAGPAPRRRGGAPHPGQRRSR
jgi:hypothetical protein